MSQVQHVQFIEHDSGVICQFSELSVDLIFVLVLDSAHDELPNKGLVLARVSKLGHFADESFHVWICLKSPFKNGRESSPDAVKGLKPCHEAELVHGRLHHHLSGFVVDCQDLSGAQNIP